MTTTRIPSVPLSVLASLASVVVAGLASAEDAQPDPAATTADAAAKLLESASFHFEVTLKLVIEKESIDEESQYRGTHAGDGLTRIEGDVMGTPIDWFCVPGKTAAKDPATGAWSAADTGAVPAMNPVDLLSGAKGWLTSAQWIEDVEVSGVPCRRAAGPTTLVPGGFTPPPGDLGTAPPEIQASQMECAIGKEDGILRGIRTVAKFEDANLGPILVMSQIEFREIGAGTTIEVPAEVRALLGLESKDSEDETGKGK